MRPASVRGLSLDGSDLSLSLRLGLNGIELESDMASVITGSLVVFGVKVVTARAMATCTYIKVLVSFILHTPLLVGWVDPSSFCCRLFRSNSTLFSWPTVGA